MSVSVVRRSGAFVAACCFFFSSRRRHTRLTCDWSSDVCSSDLRGRQHAELPAEGEAQRETERRQDDAEAQRERHGQQSRGDRSQSLDRVLSVGFDVHDVVERSEERRVGKEMRSWWSPYHYKKTK